MALPVPNPKAMLADRGYDSDNFLQDLLIYGTLSVMPSRKDQTVPQKTDWWHDRDRNSIGTSNAKTALFAMSFLNVAAVRFWVRSFVNTP